MTKIPVFKMYDTDVKEKNQRQYRISIAFVEPQPHYFFTKVDP